MLDKNKHLSYKLVSASAAFLMLVGNSGNLINCVHADTVSDNDVTISGITDAKSNSDKLKNLINLADSSAEKARVKACGLDSKEAKDFNQALAIAKKANGKNDARAYKDLAKAMQGVDSSLKVGLSRALKASQSDKFKDNLNWLKPGREDSDAVKNYKNVVKKNYQNALTAAQKAMHNSLATPDAISYAVSGLKNSQALVDAASGNVDSAKKANDMLTNSKASDTDISHIDLGQDNQLTKDALADDGSIKDAQAALKKVTSQRDTALKQAAAAVQALNKLNSDHGLEFLVEDANKFIASTDFNNLDNDVKLNLLVSLNEAEALMNSNMSNVADLVNVKSSLMQNLVLAENNLNPNADLKDAVKRAKELKNSLGLKNNVKFQVALTEAENVLDNKEATNSQKEAAVKALNGAIVDSLNGEVKALNKKLKTKGHKNKAQRTAKKSNSDSDNQAAQGDSGEGDSDDNSQTKDSADQKNGASQKSDEKSNDDSDDNADSNNSTPDDAPATSRHNNSGTLPQTGRFVLAHAKEFVIGIIAVIAAACGFLYRDKKREKKED